ncbi:hypothetical protein, partial [Shewanella sp. AC91-MNA-CIBAN-0169]|uniref:hypothetical protein n=1 Tax=Shewanella sp. AC91-MNA-CIBAN-0169 TaxID=3140466 RepID=UPI00332AD40B
EWPKGSDCKSDGSAFEGSNPSPSTILHFEIVLIYYIYAAATDIPNFKSQTSNPKLQIPNFKSQTSNPKLQIPNLKSQTRRSLATVHSLISMFII